MNKQNKHNTIRETWKDSEEKCIYFLLLLG